MRVSSDKTLECSKIENMRLFHSKQQGAISKTVTYGDECMVQYAKSLEILIRIISISFLDRNICMATEEKSINISEALQPSILKSFQNM